MGAVTLHHGTGAQDFELDGPPIAGSKETEIYENTHRLLVARGQEAALALLRDISFRIYPGTNHFGDEFHVLYADVPLAEYEVFRKDRIGYSSAARTLAETIFESDGPYIRFVAVGLEIVKPEAWEVFLCHASEDKDLVVRPVHDELEAAGIRCWLDEIEIGWGDSIVDEIQKGLTSSRYIVIVLSENLLRKPWAKRELSTAITRELDGHGARILPLMVGDAGTLIAAYPLLADKKYLVWDQEPKKVVNELRKLERQRARR